MRWRDAIIAGLIPIIVSASTALPAFDRLEGLSIDVLFWLRHQVYGPLHDPQSSPSVIVAVDEETYRRPPFKGLPKALWTPQLSSVIEATLDGGARVIGHDIILSTSVESHLPGYDRPYLVALREGARQGRIVLGKVQHLNKPISPFPGYSFAVDHERNIRLVNLFRDQDGTIRRIPLFFENLEPDGSTRIEPSMALELAARALGTQPENATDGGAKLGDFEIPTSTDNTLLLNFDTGGQAIPVYSLADLYACLQDGRTDFFRAQFDGKVVLVGSVLDVEDRKITSQRFATGPDGAWFAQRCTLPVLTGLYEESIVRDSIPGSFVHATAVNNLLREDPLRTLPRPLEVMIVILLAVLASAATMTLRPSFAVLAVIGVALAWFAVATVAFRHALALPLLYPPLASAVTFAAVLAYRFGVVDRDKRKVRQAFSYYLPQGVIDRMLDSDRAPTLGGETKELTVLFSDLAGFTSLSEKMAPEEVVSLLNQYLNEMTDIIEAQGGFVEKFIGDAIVAVFGAPLPAPDHALRAVRAALACQQRLRELEPDLRLPEGFGLEARIGINTGEMLIGNIGSRRQFNYTVMGDAVNLASRLEGVNKAYGTGILASEDTVRRCPAEIAFREVDLVRVLGRQQPLRIFEPLGFSGEIAEGQLSRLQSFENALSDFHASRFDEAAEAFDRLASEDPVAQAFAERARVYMAAPPPGDWDGVHNLDQK